jgi:hypothetical protein
VRGSLRGPAPSPYPRDSALLLAAERSFSLREAFICPGPTPKSTIRCLRTSWNSSTSGQAHTSTHFQRPTPIIYPCPFISGIADAVTVSVHTAHILTSLHGPFKVKVPIGLDFDTPHFTPSTIVITIVIVIVISYRKTLDSLKPKKWGTRNTPPPFHQIRVFPANIESSLSS